MEKKIGLGSSDLQISPLGVGAWSWGDRIYWGQSRDQCVHDAEAAFHESVRAGINFFDTAEVYASGRSEEILGRLVGSTEQEVVVGTKFMPQVWRLRRSNLLRALGASLGRLGMRQVDLYIVHWPFPPRSVETWADEMANAVEAGLVRTVGVSNYSLTQMERARKVLEQRGLSLVCNQVSYSLLNREPERSGLLQACLDLGITLVAYSPLAQGVLTGKYTPENRPSGVRRFIARRGYLVRVQPLIELLREVGEKRGKTPAQVALNWVMCKGAVPIAGARNADQARQNAGALGWRLSEDELAALDAASDRIKG